MSTALVVGDTGTDGVVIGGTDGRFMVRLNVNEALAAGTHTFWFRTDSDQVEHTAPVMFPDTQTNPTTSTAIRSVVFGPFIVGDEFGFSSTGDQTGKDVTYDVIPL